MIGRLNQQTIVLEILRPKYRRQLAINVLQILLNVRKEPNSSSQIIGTIQSNAIVDVCDISDGFARIKYKNQDAYISKKYIIKIY